MTNISASLAVPGQRRDLSASIPNPRLDISSNSNLLNVLKVSQLDAYALDLELLDILTNQLLKAIKMLDENRAIKHREDLRFFTEILYWYHTTYKGKSTPGMEMMNVTYYDTKFGRFGLLRYSQRIRLFLFGAILKYVNEKVQTFSARKLLPEHKVSKTLVMLQAIHSVMKTVNLVTFLYDGKFPNLAQRFAEVRFVHENPNAGRQMTFEYLSRALAVKELSEVGRGIVVPFMESRSFLDFTRRAKYLLGFRDNRRQRDSSSNNNDNRISEIEELELEESNQQQKQKAKKSTTAKRNGIEHNMIRDKSKTNVDTEGFDTDIAVCAACGDVPLHCNAFVARRCGCSYCYYCAAVRLEHAKLNGDWKGFACENCATRINSFRRINIRTVDD